MADLLGRVSIPTPPSSSSVFPLKVTNTPGTKFTAGTDYGYGFSQDRPVVVHLFGEADAKVEQRFAVGTGPRHFRFVKSSMSYAERQSLITFWESMGGPWESFLYQAPNTDGRAAGSFTTVRVTFENSPLSFEHLANQCRTGITFVEEIDSTSAPTYSISSTVTRFPSPALSTALLQQVQTIIPLVHILCRETTTPIPGHPPLPDNIYLSDRRVTVGGTLYLPRLQDIGEPGSSTIMSQNINGQADNVQFTLANADRAITLLSNDTDLRLASISIDLYHVNTGILLQLWKGYITSFVNDGSPSFSIQASDGLYQVMQQYPLRVIDRQCWKTFNDGLNCPYSASSTNHGGDPLSCDFYFDSTNGCVVHGMDKFFGGLPAQPQSVNGISAIISGLRNNPAPTQTSLVTDTAWGKGLQEIWCNDNGQPLNSFPASCTIIEGRDEDQYYDALGVIGAGPIGQFTIDPPTTTAGAVVVKNADGLPIVISPLLDGQTPHGVQLDPGTLTGPNSRYGLNQQVPGNDPQDTPFCLTQKSALDLPFLVAQYAKASKNRAAGVAYAEIRRTDQPGIQPTTTDQHTMTVPISKGLSGWKWDAGGGRTSIPGLVNPFWIAVNVLLRSLGLFQATSAAQLATFVLSSLANLDGVSGTAQIADLPVTPLLGTGTETQFVFQGALDTQKPLRDWLTEILSCCLGYFTFDYGKLRLGIRENAGATDAFTVGNILFQSLKLEPINATFERLYIDFADQAYQYQKNTAQYVDKSHAVYMGRSGAPLTARLNSVGGSSLSQMLRIAAVRTREEIGGITPAEWSAARTGTWQTTILALSTAVGQVVSMTHPDMPGGVRKFRIQSWKLMKDWSILITGRSVTTSMYDLTSGPKPTDVIPSPLAPIFFPIPFAPIWAPYQVLGALGDALFPNEYTFDSDQEYPTQAGGGSSAQLVITGKLPVTAFLSNASGPTIGSVTVSATGGLLVANTAYRISLTCTDSTGVPTPPSRVAVVITPGPGAGTCSIVLADIVWPAIAGLVSYNLYGSDADDRICFQQTGSITGTNPSYGPATISIPGPFQRSTYALPSPYVTKVRIKAKPLVHSGVAGFGVTTVTTGHIQCSDLVDASGSPFVATGRELSVIGRPSGPVPFASFTISSHTPSTGTLGLFPSPVGIINPGDAVVIRNKPDNVNPAPYTTITDSGYKNSLNLYAGLTVDAEKGNVIRIIKGLGRGELRKITGNTATVLSWDDPLPLDITSRWIVEANTYIWSADCTDVGNGSPLSTATVSVPVDNLLNTPVLVCGFTVDINGVESPDGDNPFREDWVYGSQGERLVNFGAAFTDALPTDGLVKFNTSTAGGGNLTYNIDLTDVRYRNRLFTWQRVNGADTHTVTINATAGAFDAAGTTQLVLTDNVNGPTGTAMFKVWG